MFRSSGRTASSLLNPGWTEIREILRRHENNSPPRLRRGLEVVSTGQVESVNHPYPLLIKEGNRPEHFHANRRAKGP
jgi:hypothetical protein